MSDVKSIFKTHLLSSTLFTVPLHYVNLDCNKILKMSKFLFRLLTSWIWSVYIFTRIAKLCCSSHKITSANFCNYLKSEKFFP